MGTMYFLTKHMTHDRGKMFPRKTLPSNKISPTNRPRGGGGWHPPLGQLLETQKGGAERVCLNTAGQFQANAHSKTAPTLEKRKVNGYNEPVVQRNVAVLSTTLLCTGLRGVGAPRGLPPLGVSMSYSTVTPRENQGPRQKNPPFGAGRRQS